MRRRPWAWTLALLSCCLGPGLAWPASGAAQEAQSPGTAPAEGWYARVETDLGTMVIRLLPDQAPQSVAHFAALAEGRLSWNDPITGEAHHGRFYDGSNVYNAAALRHFEIGDRAGDGSPAPFLFVPPVGGQPHYFDYAYRIGNARIGPRLSASRFVVTVGAEPLLNDTIPCFGLIVEGQEVARDISRVKTDGTGRPLDPLRVRSVKVYAVGEPPPLPDPQEYYPDASTMKPFEIRDRPSAPPRPR